MLRRTVLMVLAIIFSFKIYSQENTFVIPDYQDIEKLTTDKGSAFYYDNIFKRYRANDTTLTLRDYRMLYYGYFFQPQYQPFYRSAETDSIKMLLGAKDELSKADWKEIIRLGQANIEQNPFDLKGLNVVWIAYRHSGDTATANLYFDKLKKLVQTILATGDGKSEKTAFHVLNVSHEYDIVSILGYEFGGNQQLTDSKCDFLSLKENNDKVTGLYFDVKQIFKGYERSLGSKAP
jgi:hypothetical protein